MTPGPAGAAQLSALTTLSADEEPDIRGWVGWVRDGKCVHLHGAGAEPARVSFWPLLACAHRCFSIEVPLQLCRARAGIGKTAT